MKYAYAGFGMILFGMIGFMVINVFNSVTLNNETEYYVLKEAMEAAMLESVDVTCYRSNHQEGCGGVLKISEQKFVENFTRRFAMSVNGDVSQYNIKFYDIIESPPKATVLIDGITQDYDITVKGEGLDADGGFNILNNLTGILELKKLDITAPTYSGNAELSLDPIDKGYVLINEDSVYDGGDSVSDCNGDCEEGEDYEPEDEEDNNISSNLGNINDVNRNDRFDDSSDNVTVPQKKTEPKHTAAEFLGYLSDMSSKVAKDKNWKYGWPGKSNANGMTFERERKSDRELTCILLPTWGLVKMGILEEGMYLNKSTTNGKTELLYGSFLNKYTNSEVKKAAKKGLEYYDYTSGGKCTKSPKALESSGKLKAGDIIVWWDAHLSVYAGNKQWYDAGSGHNVKSGKFTTLGPNNWDSRYNGNALYYKVCHILRIKES